MDYKTLKSGTDIRGIASEGGGAPVNLTDEVVERLAAGFLLWCEKHLKTPSHELRIAVGHDSRISAGRISAALCRVFTRTGVVVYDCGLASTPSMFMATLELAADAAVQITASHHPFFRNGLKFFTGRGGLDSPDISEILAFAEGGATPADAAGGAVVMTDYMKRYAQNLRHMIQKAVNAEDYARPLKGFKIVVDAGNGAGGFYATDVLAPLGANTAGSQFLEPDGTFPNHIPNPEDAAAMESVCSAVKKAGADLGVIFDTDVDRGGAVDSRGNEINRNRLVALAAAIALENNAGGTIVTDSITSDGLKTYIETTLGGRHHRFKRGYKNVINEAVRLNKEGVNCPLAIETSGHAALRENHFLDDGAYLVTKIIIKAAQLRRAGKTLDSMLESLIEAAEERELRFPINAADFRPVGERLLSDLLAYAEKNRWAIAPDNHEGVRISFPKADGDGWFLLRMSVHDPILPLNIESNTAGGVRIIAEKLLAFLEQADTGCVDFTALTAFLAG